MYCYHLQPPCPSPPPCVCVCVVFLVIVHSSNREIVDALREAKMVLAPNNKITVGLEWLTNLKYTTTEYLLSDASQNPHKWHCTPSWVPTKRGIVTCCKTGRSATNLSKRVFNVDQKSEYYLRIPVCRQLLQMLFLSNSPLNNTIYLWPEY